MGFYYAVCLFSIVLAAFGMKTKTYLSGNKQGTVIFSMLPLWFISAFRYYCGTDYGAYINIFNSIRLGNPVENIEPVYRILNRLIADWGEDYRWVMVVTSTIFVWLVFQQIFMDSPHPGLSIYLLVAMGYYFASYNGIRQMCGAAILLYSLRFVEEKKLIKFLICVVIAYGFHATCLVFLPVYWISGMRVRPQIMAMITIIVFAGSNLIADWVNRLMLLTKYAGYAESGGDGDSRWISLLIYICILFLASLYFQDTPKYRLYYNLQMIVVWIGALNADVSWIRRVQWTFGLPSIILLPMTINAIKDKRTRDIVTLAVVVLFAAYIYIITVRSGKHDVLPYRTYLQLF